MKSLAFFLQSHQEAIYNNDGLYLLPNFLVLDIYYFLLQGKLCKSIKLQVYLLCHIMYTQTFYSFL